MKQEGAHSLLANKHSGGDGKQDTDLEELQQRSHSGCRSWAGLGIYSLCSICNAVVAYGFSAMIQETQAVLPVLTDQQITLLLSYASIVPVCAIIPTMWLLAGENGLHRTLVLGALTLVVGAGLRLLPFAFNEIAQYNELTLVLIHIGSIVNCISTTVFLTTPSAFSVAFFPDSQRTTATAIASTCFELGTAFVFLVPKITSDVTLFLFITLLVSLVCLAGMVFQPAVAIENETIGVLEREMMPSVSEVSASEGTVPVVYREISEGGRIESFGSPPRSPSPEPLEPSTSVVVLHSDPGKALLYGVDLNKSKSRRSKGRHSTLHAEELPSSLPLLQELKLALSKRSFVAMALATSVVQGVWEAWTPLVTEELTYLSEDEGDNIAFLASLGTITGGFVIGPIADRCCNQQLKSLILLCLAGMCALFALFTAVMPLPGGPLEGFPWISNLRHSGVVLYMPMFATGFFQGALVPLAYEVLAEMSYPVSEGTSGGLLQIVNNGTSLILIFVFGAGVSDEWFNLSQWVAMLFCLLIVCFTKVSYGRGPQKMAMSKGSARSSVYSKNLFQRHDTLSSNLLAGVEEGVEPQDDYISLEEELL